MLFKKKSLSDNEIKSIIHKIKQKYAVNSVEYGEGYFNIQKFYDRYYKALQDKVPIETFLNAEVLAIDDIIKKIEEKRKEGTLKRSSSSAIEKIFDEYKKRLNKYDRIKISASAFDECEKLYWCINNFYNNYYTSLNLIKRKIYSMEINEIFNEIDTEFTNFTHKRGNRLPTYIEDYKEKISRQDINSEDIQKAGNPLLQRAYILLKSVRKYIKILNNADYVLKHISFTVNDTVYDIYKFRDKILNEIEQILFDFRLKGLE